MVVTVGAMRFDMRTEFKPNQTIWLVGCLIVFVVIIGLMSLSYDTEDQPIFLDLLAFLIDTDGSESF